MMLADFIYRFIPEKSFRQLQQIYHRWKKSVYKPVSEQDFIGILNKMGIKKGDVVFVHSSFDKLNTSFSANRLLNILTERVGSEGTLLFPSWNYDGRTADYARLNKVFDVKKSFTKMGLIPELARRRKSAIRSLHPTASVAAIGKHARELTNSHHLSEYTCDKQSPYYKLMAYHGKIIGLGEKTVSMSFLHCVEDVMLKEFPVRLYHNSPVMVRYKNYDGKEKMMEVFVHDTNYSPDNIPGFIRRHVSESACSQFSVSGRNYFVADSVKLFDELSNLAKKGKTIYST